MKIFRVVECLNCESESRNFEELEPITLIFCLDMVTDMNKMWNGTM